MGEINLVNFLPFSTNSFCDFLFAFLVATALASRSDIGVTFRRRRWCCDHCKMVRESLTTKKLREKLGNFLFGPKLFDFGKYFINFV